MSKKNKKIKQRFSLSKLTGIIVVSSFCLFLGSFIYEIANAESIDPTQRWCANCNTYHDINDETLEEIWCNNCNTWHAPNEESRVSNLN
tara:strand:+ start:288 stop:554 length:267 start_codon:yes stop_codon:yes gene_type:complete